MGQRNALHAAAGGLHVAIFIVSILIATKKSIDPEVAPVIYRVTRKGDSVTPEIKTKTIDPKAILMMLLSFTAITAAFHFVQIFFHSPDNPVNTARWIEYSITATIMIILISLLSGVNNEDTLILCAVSTFVTMVLGNVVERLLGKDQKRTTYLIHALGWALMLGVWVVIIKTFFETIEANDNVPVVIYSIVFVLFVLYNCFGVVQSVQLFRPQTNVYTIDKMYTLLSFVSKTSLTFMILFGLTRS